MAVEAGVHVIIVAGTILRIIVATGAHREAEVIETLLGTSLTLVTTTAVFINLTTVLVSILRSTPTANTVKRKGRSIIATIAIIQVNITRSTTPSTPILTTPAKITMGIIIVVNLQTITAAIVGRVPIMRYQANLQAGAIVIVDPIRRKFSATQMAVATREPGGDIGEMNSQADWKGVVCK